MKEIDLNEDNDNIYGFADFIRSKLIEFYIMKKEKMKRYILKKKMLKL